MNGFHAKTIDDQISLNRKLTFRHLKDVFRVAFIIVLKLDSENSCGYIIGETCASALPQRKGAGCFDRPLSCAVQS
jgi:hypothetical protein